MKPQKTVAKIFFSFCVYQEKCPNTQGYKLAYTEYLSKTRSRSENLPILICTTLQMCQRGFIGMRTPKDFINRLES